MVERVEVTDPHSGATLRVAVGSPQAKAWGEPAAGKSEPVKPAEVVEPIDLVESDDLPEPVEKKPASRRRASK